MAVRRPVVVIDGVLKQLPVGDTVEGASGSSTVYTATAEVDFGSTSSTNVEVSVPAVWAGTISPFNIDVSPNLTDHDYEDVLIEGIRAIIGTINPGVGFTVFVHAPEDTWGGYNVTIRGLG